MVLSLYLGTIPFWYDPARDLQLAIANHQKISLIGQTSGIPGIFYGPYWVWFLSLALLVSKDPRIVAFIVLTIPYFVLLPFLLFKLRKIYGNLVPVLLWLIFIISFSPYAMQIWNPHLAPLLCLATIYLLAHTNYKKAKWKDYSKSFIAGITGGLLMNIHISFGLSVVVGSIFFLFLRKNRLKTLLLFGVGLLLIYIPFFVFEVRHGFNQIQTLVSTISSSSSVVEEVSSIDKMQIIIQFFKRFSILLHLPLVAAYILSGVGVLYGMFRFNKSYLFVQKQENNLVLLILTITFSMLGIYLSTKNPVWDYHFIGVEILFLLILGLFAKKFSFVKYALVLFSIVISILFITSFVKGLDNDPYKVPSFATKHHIINTIYDDAGGNSFSVFTYSPATFTPDFDYLLVWEGKRRNKANLVISKNSKLVYLIIPWTTPDLKADFIDNRTPSENYKMTKSWQIADETTIIKRQRYQE